MSRSKNEEGQTVTDRGVVGGFDGMREIACSCPCHNEPMLHFVACCHEPRTDEGRMSLNACVILAGIIATHGGASGELATFRKENPGLERLVDASVARWQRGRINVKGGQ